MQNWLEHDGKPNPIKYAKYTGVLDVHWMDRS